MANTTPEITTYASTKERIQLAIQSGANHIILEEPEFSIRSFLDTTTQTESLSDLITTAQSLAPNIMLSYQCDKVCHHHDLEKITDKLHQLNDTPISTIRIQDLGLISLIKEIAPTKKIQYLTETGNQNTASIQFLSQLTQGQTLTNELPHSELNTITNTINTEFEIQVQGPILIQYSFRRFMEGIKKEENAIIKLAQDQEYPNRYYKFYDNPHGHFMYLYLHRCLLNTIPTLKKLNLRSWLIDARGESDTYLTTAITAYNHALESNSNSRTDIESNTVKSIISTLEKESNCPQKPGFFRANNTDKDLSNKNLTDGKSKDQQAIVGKVLDSNKGICFTIEPLTTLQQGDKLHIKTPQGKEIKITLTTMTTIDNQAITEANPYQLIKLPWKKHITPKSFLFKR